MNNFNFKTFVTKNLKRIIIAAIIVILVAVIMIVFSNYKKNHEAPIFSIKEIIIYSNANVINHSNNQSLENLSLCQYSDLSIYVDNTLSGNELVKANTIKKLYIDNISITSKNGNGTQVLNYKNPLTFGKYMDINQLADNKINFNVIRTNNQNNATAYNIPTFYTDCSNPITLGYLNTDIMKNYSISDNTNIVSYNAKVLKEANINIDDIKNTLNFTIHIVNNKNHKYSCNMSITLPLDEDFFNNGYSYIKIPVSGDEYKFVRE